MLHVLQDPQYRTTVAAMLAQQTADENQPSQFIVTTFHPQIIQQADKVYGVSHTNRISRIDVVSQARRVVPAPSKPLTCGSVVGQCSYAHDF